MNKLKKDAISYPGQASPFSLIPLPIAPEVPPHVDVQQGGDAVPRLQQIVDKIAGQSNSGLRGGLQGQRAGLWGRRGARVPWIDPPEAPAAPLRPPTTVTVTREPAVVVVEAILTTVLVAPTSR